MRGVEPAPTAGMGGLRRSPLGAAAGQLGFGDAQLEAATGNVQLDLVAISHQRQRPADGGLGCDVEDDGAVRGTAHPGVREAHHVAHAALEQLLRDREVADLRHPRRIDDAGILQHQHFALGHDQLRIISSVSIAIRFR